MPSAQQRAQERPLKVLAITVRADIGGGPEHLYQLTSAMEGVETTIACPEDVPYADRYRALPTVPRVEIIPHRAFQVAALRRLAGVVRRDGIEVIHSHGKGAGLYARALAVMTGRACVHTFHGLHVGEYGALKKRLYLGLERVMGRATRAAIAVSDGEAAQIRAAGLVPDAKLHVIDNGVFVPEDVTHAPQQEVLQVVAVNRYDTQKHPELLLEIARGLKARAAPVHITVIGQGDALETCRATARAEALESHITLAGPTHDPRAALRKGQVFLSTSRWEGMPLAVLEAMSEGLAPVLTDVVGNRDVVEHQTTGLLYPNEDAPTAIEHLMALAEASDICDRLGQAAHEAATQRYSTTRMAQQTQALYLAALARDTRVA